MSTYTDNILLTLRDASDPVDVAAFNRDNGILDQLLGPVAEDYSVLRSAARINSYNLFKTILAAHYDGVEVPNKTAMFFGDYTTAADSASANALHSLSKGCYMFSDSVGSSVTIGEIGDATSELTTNQCRFSVTALGSCLLTGLEVDVKATTSNADCYITNFSIGGGTTTSLNLGDMSQSRSIMTYTFSNPRVVNKGDVITGIISTLYSDYHGYAYGSATGAPYVKLYFTPATPTGWLSTTEQSLGAETHNEARAFIQCDKGANNTIAVTLTDDESNTVTMTLEGGKAAVTPSGAACTELCFVAPYTADKATLKISADADDGHVYIYNYAVTVL